VFSTIGKLAGRFGVPDSGEPSQAACAWGFAASSDALSPPPPQPATPKVNAASRQTSAARLI
jgi:hypothetical protein